MAHITDFVSRLASRRPLSEAASSKVSGLLLEVSGSDAGIALRRMDS